MERVRAKSRLAVVSGRRIQKKNRILSLGSVFALDFFSSIYDRAF
jgi:hypothetical protein